MTKPDHTDPQDSEVQAPEPDVSATGLPKRAGARAGAKLPAMMRLVLLAVSVGGTLAALSLWVGGNGGLAVRILAGSIVLIVTILLAF